MLSSWIDFLVDTTVGHAILSFINAYSGYNQIWMYLGDEEKISFTIDHRTYYYSVIPFDLKNVSATYQCLVNLIFRLLNRKSMEVYMDDFLVRSINVSNHFQYDIAHSFLIP